MELGRQAIGTTWFTDFTIYEARLRENIDRERHYGSNEQIRADRAEIVDQLNRLAYTHLKVSFNDLCRDVWNDIPHESKLMLDHTGQDGRTTKTQKSLSMAAAKPIRTSAFISYSSQDEQYLDELKVQLEHYKQQENLSIWDKTQIKAGAIPGEEIKKALQSTKVAVLLISADFLASSSIINEELSYLLAAAKQEGVIILSVILRPCAFESTELAQFRTVNDPSKPLSTMSLAKREMVWVQVAKLVQNAVHA